MRGANCGGKTTEPGRWRTACKSLVFYSRGTLSNTSAYRGVSPTSKLRAEVRMRTGHFFWAKNREGSGEIGLRELFNTYWRSNEREFMVTRTY